MKTASILCVGTELTTGQIFNTNASWLSKHLRQLGIRVAYHLTVADQRENLLESLKFCAQNSNLIFVTGGLGPTSDDFTRDLISEWSGAPLSFDQKSWKHVEDILASRNLIAKDIQRQQCFFPEGAEIFENQVGTANAFRIMARGVHVFVLPGPPNEIQSLWENSMTPWLIENTPAQIKMTTEFRDTMGLPESDIAIKVEKIFKGTPVELGYRVHMPYVEVKITFKDENKEKISPYIEKLDRELANWIVLKNEEDIAELLAKKISRFDKIFMEDLLTNGHLYQRLFPFIKQLLKKQIWQCAFNTKMDLPPILEKTLLLRIQQLENGQVAVSCEFDHFQQNRLFDGSQLATPFSERQIKVLSEKAFFFWNDSLSY